jgi:hypothetical protein
VAAGLLALAFTAKAGNPVICSSSSYSVTLESSAEPALLITCDGKRLIRLPVVSSLSMPGREEILSAIQLSEITETPSGERLLIATAHSSLWTSRRFVWKFFPDHLEFQHFAQGAGLIDRCYFFSSVLPGRFVDTANHQSTVNANVYADRYFSPRVNHADQYYYTAAMPQTVGLNLSSGQTWENPLGLGANLFASPLMLAFHRAGRWASLGIGTSPGGYQFNTLDYSGQRYAGAAFSVSYGGKTTVGSEFASPVAALHFGHNEFEVLADYVHWLDEHGFSTRHRYPNAPWHRRPIFCGWGQQMVESPNGIPKAGEMATQANYERWLERLEARGLPVGTVIIDDKWALHDGLLDIDETKWPDLKGFIARQHAKDRHVLLWIDDNRTDGLAPELCVLRDGKPISGDVSNPAYRDFLRSRVKYLIADIGADGFKEDGVHGLDFAGAKQQGAPYGQEFVALFQRIVAEETHRWRPDALIETQTPNPLFRESSDVLRLNDVWWGARNVTAMMTIRARIAWAAGWPLVDTDNPSSAGLEEWWDYTVAQPAIGIPCLYIVTATEGSHENVTDEQWQQLAMIWKDYLSRL